MSSQDTSDAEELSQRREAQAETDAADLARYRATKLLTKPAPASDTILAKPTCCGGILGSGVKEVEWTGCGPTPASPAACRDTAKFDVKLAG